MMFLVRSFAVVLFAVWVAFNVLGIMAGSVSAGRQSCAVWPETWGAAVVPGFYAGCVLGEMMGRPYP